MKQVKFDGSRWILLTPDGGFFNPQKEVYFAGSDSGKIAAIMHVIDPVQTPNKIYEIPDNHIYVSVHDAKCGPLWPDPNCYECGGKGVLAAFDTIGMQMGGTEMGNQEVEKIKNGTSSIEFPKG